ncbi:sulfurtransferase-like selenium metabolism protein YedF [Megasphaera hominis]|jgi:selenium metabolism protein YedF|uniref:Sulfurtransferase-like selenium metabolism protein YedF n=1 Tax=Megasphaera hominis TaxID=159836 RepID=A0ABR6VKG1_9FIRM|nr:sulfurtransferase-like selenium metabolism protein YedF [Megasphaera hominis]MBC3537189.1 sulfurtransferase-like selenium metabolism protein YedF [Megasphaera hominis]
MFTIDALGKACPLPVIETRKALKEHDAVTTVVDNKIATENLKKMADQLGYTYALTVDSPTHYTVIIAKTDAAPETTAAAAPAVPEATSEAYIVVINSPMMGVGDEKFSRNLLKTFIYTLTEQDVLPQRIIFYNGGVPLVTKTSESLEDLQKLAAAGVEIYACGACLNYYGLTDDVAVGEITNMFRIIEMMRTANRIVRP